MEREPRRRDFPLDAPYPGDEERLDGPDAPPGPPPTGWRVPGLLALAWLLAIAVVAIVALVWALA